MLSVNYNPSVLKAQNNLTSATSSLTRSLERMSTGYRINSAKDDAAGMFVASNLTTQIRGLLQARKNASDGISYITTASESLMGMGKILNRMRDLAVQGANGVYDGASRGAMQAEADELTKELYRIKNSTVFNGQKIFGGGEIGGTSGISIFSVPEVSGSVSTAGLAGVARVSEVPAGYVGIYTADDLDAMRNNLNGKYILMNDIDLSGYANWEPIGGSSNPFKGMIDGNGHVIRNLKIDRASEDYVGLFGNAQEAQFTNISITNANVTGGDMTGILVGYFSESWQHISSSIDRCYTQGNVKGKNQAGGIVGNLAGRSINASWSDAKINGNEEVGGLAGRVYQGAINDSFFSGSVSGNSSVGGLVGYLFAYSSLRDSYSTGAVAGVNDTGGAIGKLNGSTFIEGSFWDIQKSLQTDGVGFFEYPYADNLKGLTSEEMKNPQYFIDAGWDSTLWDLTSAPPKLAWQPKQEESGGNLRLQIGANGDEASVIHADTLFEIGNFSVDYSSKDASAASIDTIDGLLAKINTKISDFGAVLNRLDSILAAQTTSIENLTASRSTIQDADIAEESANYVKNQILQQTTSSLLTQAQRSQSSVIRALIGR